jgi:hypothetical protein
MRFAVLLLVVFLAAPVLSAQHPVPSGGQWLIEPGEHQGIVRLTIRYGERRYSDSWDTQEDVPSSELVGLSPADMGGSGTTVHFMIVRSAGTLTCEGRFDEGKGSGHFTYQPNPDFVAELAKRGINAPTAWEQFSMTMAGVGVDLVDELKREGYDRPTAGDLARMGTHGVDLEYVRDIGARGYHLRDSKSLVRMRDHGVDPEFIESLDSAGYRNLGAEDLVRLRDHGVEGDYIAEMKAVGYAPSNPEELVESRDHGVDPSYITSLRQAGYEHLSLQELRRARDHGVTRGFIQRVKDRGYGKPSLDEVIRLRDRGSTSGQGQNRTADTRIFSSEPPRRVTGTTGRHQTLSGTTLALRLSLSAAVVPLVAGGGPWSGGQPGDSRSASHKRRHARPGQRDLHSPSVHGF